VSAARFFRPPYPDRLPRTLTDTVRQKRLAISSGRGRGSLRGHVGPQPHGHQRPSPPPHRPVRIPWDLLQGAPFSTFTDRLLVRLGDTPCCTCVGEPGHPQNTAPHDAVRVDHVTRMYRRPRPPRASAGPTSAPCRRTCGLPQLFSEHEPTAANDPAPPQRLRVLSISASTRPASGRVRPQRGRARAVRGLLDRAFSFLSLERLDADDRVGPVTGVAGPPACRPSP